ncbi:MAG: ATP synthase subunit I [Peptostreptococcaceae bacterium]|nr:ATP synthase subunit I [Peptostreptococcaceae bacterium]
MTHSDLRVRVISYAAFLSIITLGIGIFVVKNDGAFVKGLLLGFSISALMFLQTAKTVEKAVTLSPGDAQKLMTSRYFARMLIYGAVLVLSAKVPNINILATTLGLVSIRFAILVMTIWNKLG